MIMANEQGTGTMAQKRLPRRVSQGVFLASLALVAVISFVAGMRSDELYHIVAPIFGVKVAKQPLNTEIMNEVYRELVANYDGDLDVDKLSDGAARGMTKAVGDDYTSFMDKK